MLPINYEQHVCKQDTTTYDNHERDLKLLLSLGGDGLSYS
jgi:hypothetical protein